MKITIFSEELRKCLNAAGLPDYTWNYWYQRLMNAYNECVERQIVTEQAENAKLREDLEFERSENGWVREFLNHTGQKCGTKDCPSLVAYVTKMETENAKLRELVRELYEIAQPEAPSMFEAEFADRMRELGVEVD